MFVCRELALGIYLIGRFHEDGGRQQFAYPCFERAAEFGVARVHYDLALYAEQGVQRPLEQVCEGTFIFQPVFFAAPCGRPTGS